MLSGFRCRPGQANKIGGLIAIAPNVNKVADGYTGRRPIVEDARWQQVPPGAGRVHTRRLPWRPAQRRHDLLVVPSSESDQQRLVGDSDQLRSFHPRRQQREHPFTWTPGDGESFAEVSSRRVLKNCEGCHVRGSYDFSNSASQSALPNRLYRTVATGFFALNVGDTYPTYSGASCAAGTSEPQTDVGAYEVSPFVMGYPANHGTGFSYNAGLTASNSCTTDVASVSNPPGGTLQADCAAW